MKMHIIFEKNTYLANAILATGKVKNEGNWIFSCQDNIEDMKAIQKVFSEKVKNTPYKNYKLTFANENDYSDFITF